MARDAARWSVLLGRLALIALALIAPYTAALSRNDLYHYTGPGASALESDPNGMLMSAEATLKTPVAFYDRIYNSIFVSTDRKRRGQTTSRILGFSPEVYRRYNRSDRHEYYSIWQGSFYFRQFLLDRVTLKYCNKYRR